MNPCHFPAPVNIAILDWIQTLWLPYCLWTDDSITKSHWFVMQMRITLTTGVNIKIPSYPYMDSHYKDLMVSWLSCCYNGNPCTWTDYLYIEMYPRLLKTRVHHESIGKAAFWTITRNKVIQILLCVIVKHCTLKPLVSFQCIHSGVAWRKTQERQNFSYNVSKCTVTIKKDRII